MPFLAKKRYNYCLIDMNYEANMPNQRMMYQLQLGSDEKTI